MNKNYLIRVFGVGLLGLLTGVIPLGAKPAAAETADASTLQKLAETLEADNDDRALAEAADDSVSLAPTPTETIGSNEAGTNLNTSAAELGKADSISLSSTSHAQDLPSSESVTGMAAPATGDEQLSGEESSHSAIANRQQPLTQPRQKN